MSRLLLIVPAFLTLLDAPAQITWRRTYGGMGSDHANSVRQTSDGGYIIAGATGSFGSGSGDIYVVRTDAFGEPLWSRTYGDLGVDRSISCRELSDGFIIAGTTSIGSFGGYDMLLIRTDAAGEPIWQKAYGTPDWDVCNAFDVMSDGFVLGGISFGAGPAYGVAYIVRTDLNGDTLWTRIINDPFKTECSGIAATSDQGVAVVGSIATASGFDDAFIAKLDQDGGEEWRTMVGGDSADYFIGVAQAPDGSYAASGGTHSQNPYMQILLAGFDASGGGTWEQYLGSVADAAATEIRNDHDSGFVFTGYNTLNLGERDIILTTTDNDGWFQFGNNYGDGEPADGYSIDTTSDGGYVAAGWAEGYGPGPRAMYVVKTDSTGLTADLSVNSYSDPLAVAELASGSSATLHPNPITSSSILSLGITCDTFTLTDMSGRRVFERSIHPSERTVVLNGVEPGIYVATLQVQGRPVRVAQLVIQ